MRWVYCYCSACYPKRPSSNTTELDHLRAKKREIEQQLALRETELLRLKKSEASSYPMQYYGETDSKGKKGDEMTSGGLDYLAMVAMLKRY
jgi:hypothetical protein